MISLRVNFPQASTFNDSFSYNNLRITSPLLLGKTTGEILLFRLQFGNCKITLVCCHHEAPSLTHLSNTKSNEYTVLPEWNCRRSTWIAPPEDCYIDPMQSLLRPNSWDCGYFNHLSPNRLALELEIRRSLTGKICHYSVQNIFSLVRRVAIPWSLSMVSFFLR